MGSEAIRITDERRGAMLETPETPAPGEGGEGGGDGGEGGGEGGGTQEGGAQQNA
jgi:hypothetical protein